MQDDSENRKEGVAAFFGQASATFGQDDEGIRRFPHFGRRLVAAANLPAGAQVLDVATGRGAVLFPAAEQIGPQGHVLGIDIVPDMVAATDREIDGRALANAEVRVMDAEQLDLPAASFDALLCGFGLMFLPHLPEALAGFRRVLRPGGTLAVSTWMEPGADYAWEMELWRAYGIADRHPWALMANRLAKLEDLAAALRGAGFSDVHVLTELDERLHADAAEWWARSRVLPGARAALDSLGTERLEQFKQGAFAQLQRLTGPGGIPQRIEALFGLARNP
jgi:ubiquinone/menaquinone biosynthesis C-methylase UbiE